MDSIQASLKSEQNAKAETHIIQKKLETDMNEFDVDFDHVSKTNNETLKSVRGY